MPALLESTESTLEKIGEIEEEKTFHAPKLGGNFVFRLPYVMDELTVLRGRVQIMGIAEELAGPELIAVAHARAMFDVYCVHKPHGFTVDRLRSWRSFLQLMGEVRDWHQNFFQSLESEEGSPSPGQS